MSYLINPYIYSGIVTSGLVLNLDASNTISYPGTGTTWYDLSSNPSNATLTNGPTYTYPYIQFDATDDYATIASNSKFAFGTGDFTIEVWAYPQSFSTYFHLVALPNQNTFALKTNVTDGAIYYYDPSFTTYGSTAGWTFTLNTWHQVVLVRQSNIAYAYLNTISRGSKSGFNTNMSAQILNIHNGYAGEFAQGRISVVNIYNRSLSIDEISKNFNSLRSKYGI